MRCSAFWDTQEYYLHAREYIGCEAVTFPLQSSYLVMTIAMALSGNSGDYHGVL